MSLPSNSKIWGQYLWRTLHTVTYCYRPDLPDQTKHKFVRFFYVLRDVIPCPICREHYKKRIASNPPENNMGSTEQLVTWLNILHNEVNAGLGKPLVSIMYANSYYVRDGKLTYDFKDLVVLFKIMHMIKTVNYPAVRKFLSILFEIYPDNILIKYAPKCHKFIKTIENSQTLNAWASEFDTEFNHNKINGIEHIKKPKQDKPPKTEEQKRNKQLSKVVRQDIQDFLQKYNLV